MEIEIVYKKGIIYQIYCNVTGEIYIGGTTKKLNDRMNVHKAEQNRTSSRPIIDRNNYNVSILCEMLFTDKIYLRQTEQKYIETTLNCINKNNAYISPEQLKNIKNEKSKEYYRNNRDTLLIKKNTKYLCSCGKTYTYSNKSAHYRTKYHKKNCKSRE